MTKEFKLIMIPMPYKINYEVPPGKKEDGPKFHNNVLVESLSKEDAEEYANEMKEAFLAHWAALGGQ